MKIKFLPQVLIIVLAIFIRFVSLDKVPSALYYDEVDLGYQMKSFLSTGKDYRNTQSPFYFRSFNTDKTPLPILISSLVSLPFKSPEYQVRAGTALVGTLVVLLAMIIAFQLTNSNLASIISGLVFALSPWQVHFSRLAFEAEFALFFLFLFLATFYHWLIKKNKIAFFISAIVLGLSVYTYRTMSLLTPLVVMAVLVIFYRDFLKIGIIKSIIWIGTVLIFSVPFLYATTIASKDQPRINQISIFSDPMIPIMVQRNREVDSGDYQSGSVGNQATLKSKIFFNKALSILEKYRDNTFGNFSPSFLFLSGDPNGRHSAKSSGELLFLDVLALLVGGYYIYFQLQDKKYILLLILLFIGAIPSNLTLDGANHASRLITFSGPLLLIVSLGYFRLIKNISKRKPGQLFLVVVVFLWIFATLQFLNKYFYHFPVENHREFGYGYKQVTEKISEHQSKFKKVYITDQNDPPMLYYLFWANIPPKDIQNYGTEFGLNIIKNKSLDKIKPYHFDTALCEIKGIVGLNPDTLYVVSFNNLPLDFRSRDKDLVPQGIKLLEVIKYPNNEPAYYFLTRDAKDNKSVDPLKTQKCK